ncbi:unnamed protein product, partial [Mesorhabditis belari]|uniref:Protein kinase domain-containing protein n=1 Tax=Mesorhabditis belari TaxID=2138241 RepID=A0AAF3F656_9BILA
MVHRDIKPANVLVTQAFWLKLADFGEIKEIQKTCSTFTDVGTRRYMSPEQTRTTDVIKLNHKSDIYSMGLVLWELIERRQVFSNYGKEDVYSINPNATQLIDLESFDCTHEIRQVVERCTAFDMNKRPYARELKALLPKKETITLKMKPEEDEKETRLIRPIGFDGTKNRVYIEGSGYLTPPHIHTSSTSQSVAAHSSKSPTTSSTPLKKETKFHGNPNPLDFASLRSELMEIVKESQPTSSVNSENGEEVKKRGRPPGSKNKTGSQVKKNSTGSTIAKKPSSASLFD